MIGVAFFAENRNSCGKQNHTEMWLSLCRTFDIDRQLVIDKVGIPCFAPAEDPNHPAEIFQNFVDIFEAYPDAHYVMVERQGQADPTPLPDYRHPKGDVIYCFGPDSGGIETYRPPKADWVMVPMSDKTQWGMWAIMTATIVMHDRWTRGNN